VAGCAASAAAAAAVSGPCVGEYTRCASGACAFNTESCAQCPPGEYACPLSTACSPDGAFASCPGLAGTLFDASLPVDARLDWLIPQLTLPELLSQMTDNTTGIARFSVPPYVALNDDQHGVKSPNATAFPNGVTLGAAWDEELLFRVGLALGVESRGVHNGADDKSGQHALPGQGGPGTLVNGQGMTYYAPNLNLVHDVRVANPRRGARACAGRARVSAACR